MRYLAATLAALGGGLGRLLEKLTESELETLIKDLLASAVVETEGRTAPMMPLFDGLFAGKALKVFEVLAFALEANLGDFFEPWRNLMARASQAKGSPSGLKGSTSTPGSVTG